MCQRGCYTDRGDSGKRRINKARIPAGTIWIPSGMRHTLLSNSPRFLLVPYVQYTGCNVSGIPFPWTPIIITCYYGSVANHKLLQTCQTSTGRWMRYLGLVERDYHHQETDTDSRNSSSGVEEAQVLCTGLECAAEYENDSTDHDGKSSTKIISARSSEGSAEECAASEYRDDSTTMSRA